ncbi:MAG: sensor histidine kinase [Cyanobacteria bacterium P01_A01_bin.45]
MAKTRQSSFRRILISRILLLSVPVLLTGEMVLFQKARSSLLDTAGKNLTESAIIKGDMIKNSISALRSNLLSASRTTALQTGSQAEIYDFINKLKQYLPTKIECIQLTSIDNGTIVNSTCGEKPIKDFRLPLPSQEVDLEVSLPPKSGKTGIRDAKNQLRLVFSAPVFNQDKKLKYTLTVQSLLQLRVRNQNGILTGSTVIISENGTVLAHHLPTRVGTSINEHTDAKRLQNALDKSINGQRNFLHLFFEKNGQELLAGYSGIKVPISEDKQEKWAIFAVTSLENALYGLEQIQVILIILTVCLIGGSVLASLYLARQLANPIEKLGEYALNLHLNSDLKPVPKDFQIREFNQLSQALAQMVERLRIWAGELEIAWKDAKDASTSKTQFLANTSHELRNPLNIIINCVRLVRDDMCDSRDEELEFLKRADDTAIHLLGIINDLLDISKIEAGKLSVVKEPLDLKTIIQEVINIQSVTVQQKGLQFNIPELNDIIPVNADPAKLKQVLINVISNATKFTEKGSITITTEIENIDQKPYVAIAVKDTGIGIEATQQQKLFRPFVMVEDSNGRKFGGTGLGLAISRNLMEMMEGSITLESAGLGFGTTITVYLPLIDANLLYEGKDAPQGIMAYQNNHRQEEKTNSNSCASYSIAPEGTLISSSGIKVIPKVENWFDADLNCDNKSQKCENQKSDTSLRDQQNHRDSKSLQTQVDMKKAGEYLLQKHVSENQSNFIDKPLPNQFSTVNKYTNIQVTTDTLRQPQNSIILFLKNSKFSSLLERIRQSVENGS